MGNKAQTEEKIFVEKNLRFVSCFVINKVGRARKLKCALSITTANKCSYNYKGETVNCMRIQ